VAGVAQMVGICIVRNGENCKNCIYYGKLCESYRRNHRGKKPMDVDEDKQRETRRYYKNEKRREK